MTDNTFYNDQFYQPADDQSQDQYEVLPHLRDYFQEYELTASQEAAVQQLESFFAGDTQVFLLKGYAGTGKTFLLQGIIKYLRSHEYQVISCAPTGKAASVLQQKVNPLSSTIHRTIYSFHDLEGTQELISIKDDIDNDKILYRQSIKAALLFGVVKHLDGSKIVMIVDESSMISDVNNFSEDAEFICGSGKLLKDIFDCIQLDSYSQRKIIFVGDPAQLPPVNMHLSPALNASYINKIFNYQSLEYELTDVVRQKADSALIFNATYIRTQIQRHSYSNFSLKLLAPEVIALSNEINDHGTTNLISCLHNIADQYRQNLQQLSLPTLTFIAATNDKVLDYNLTLRKFVFPQLESSQTTSSTQQQNEILQTKALEQYLNLQQIDPLAKTLDHAFDLQQGELLLVVKNNHLYQIFNGQQIIIKQYDFNSYREFTTRFYKKQKPKDNKDNKKNKGSRDSKPKVVSLTLRFINVVIIRENYQISDTYIEQPCKLLLNRLYTRDPEQITELFQALNVNFNERYKKSHPQPHIDKDEYRSELRYDPYYNALQTSFGYAITCHKAQGSEWDKVYIDCAIKAGKDEPFFRWFYTALTRAKKQVTLINYHPFNSFSKAFKPNYSYGTGKSSLSSTATPEAKRPPVPHQSSEIAHSVNKANNVPKFDHWQQLSADNKLVMPNEESKMVNVHKASPAKLRSGPQEPRTTQTQHLSKPAQTVEEFNPCAWQDEGWSDDGDYSDYWGQSQTTAPEFDDFYDDYYCDADMACHNSAAPLSNTSTVSQAPQVQLGSQAHQGTQVQQDNLHLKSLAPNNRAVASTGNREYIPYQTQQQPRTKAEEMSAAITPDKTGVNCVSCPSQQPNAVNSFSTPAPSVEPLEVYCQRLVDSSSIPLRAQFDGNFQYQKRMVFVSEADKKKFMRVMLSYNGSEVFSAVMLSKSTLPAEITQQVLALLKANILHNSISQIESSVLPQHLTTQPHASLSNEQMGTATLEDAPIPDDIDLSLQDALKVFVTTLKERNIVVLSWESKPYRLRFKVMDISTPAGATTSTSFDLIYNGKCEITRLSPVGKINKQQADLFNAIQDVISALG